MNFYKLGGQTIKPLSAVKKSLGTGQQLYIHDFSIFTSSAFQLWSVYIYISISTLVFVCVLLHSPWSYSVQNEAPLLHFIFIFFSLFFFQMMYSPSQCVVVYSTLFLPLHSIPLYVRISFSLRFLLWFVFKRAVHHFSFFFPSSSHFTRKPSHLYTM